MTFREKLADWISGGAVTREKTVSRLALDRFVKQRMILDRIAAMETPSANATVRRMAKIAREAME